MRSHDPCRHEGCTRPRTRHSVFCDAHHQEQLIRAGLRPAVLPVHDPRVEQVRRCERVLKAHQSGLITTDELHGQLADLFVHAGMNGESEHWPHCFDSLPAGTAAHLLSYLRASARPHGFAPTSPERVEAAREAQSRLESALEAWLRGAAGQFRG
jgi:hypothetical protein